MSVAFTFINWKQTAEKNCSQESMGHECRLYVYRLKMNSGKKLVMSVAFTFTDWKWTVQKIVPTKACA